MSCSGYFCIFASSMSFWSVKSPDFNIVGDALMQCKHEITDLHHHVNLPRVLGFYPVITAGMNKTIYCVESTLTLSPLDTTQLPVTVWFCMFSLVDCALPIIINVAKCFIYLADASVNNVGSRCVFQLCPAVNFSATIYRLDQIVNAQMTPWRWIAGVSTFGHCQLKHKSCIWSSWLGILNYLSFR